MKQATPITVIHRDVDYFTQDKKGEDKSYRVDFQFNEEDSKIVRLEKIWRAMNVVQGDELPVKLGIRSMMVHDQVEMDGKTYQVASVGWIDALTQRNVEDED